MLTLFAPGTRVKIVNHGSIDGLMGTVVSQNGSECKMRLDSGLLITINWLCVQTI